MPQIPLFVHERDVCVYMLWHAPPGVWLDSLPPALEIETTAMKPPPWCSYDQIRDTTWGIVVGWMRSCSTVGSRVRESDGRKWERATGESERERQWESANRFSQRKASLSRTQGGVCGMSQHIHPSVSLARRGVRVVTWHTYISNVTSHTHVSRSCTERVTHGLTHELHTSPTHITYTHHLHTSPTHITYTHHLHTSPTHITYTHEIHTCLFLAHTESREACHITYTNVTFSHTEGYAWHDTWATHITYTYELHISATHIHISLFLAHRGLRVVCHSTYTHEMRPSQKKIHAWKDKLKN